MLLFFSVPFIWIGFHFNEFNVGGDAPNLIFINPWSFLVHNGLSTRGDNLLGYNPSLQYLSLAALALILKSVHLNPQAFCNGLTLAATYLGCRTLVLDLFPDSRAGAEVGGYVAGVVAVAAPLIGQSFWTNFLSRLYLLALIPWLAIFLGRFLRTAAWRYGILAGILCAVGASAWADIPGSIPALILVGGLAALYLSWPLIRVTTFVKALGFSGLVICMNAYWVVPLLLAAPQGQIQASYASSTAGKSAAVTVVNSLAPLQSLSDLLNLRTSQPMMAAYQWAEVPADAWYGHFPFLGYVPFLCICLALPFAMRRSVAARIRYTYLFGLVMLVLFLGLISLRFPPGFLQVFDFLLRHLPGWVAERNFYETFAIPYVLTTAFMAGLSVAIILSAVHLQGWLALSIRVLVLLIVTSYTVLYGWPLFSGVYFRLPYFDGGQSDRVVTSFPSGYLQLGERISAAGAGPGILSLPIITPTWSDLTWSSGQRTENYLGVSPLYFLMGIPDYDGLESFAAPVEVNLATALEDDAEIGDFQPIVETIRFLRLPWIVEEIQPTLPTDFDHVTPTPTRTAAIKLDAELIRGLHARQVAASGNYRLFDIPGGLHTRVSTSSLPPNSEPGILQVATGLAKAPPVANCRGLELLPRASEIRLATRSATTCTIILSEAFSKLWTMRIQSGSHVYTLRAREAYGYANSFALPAGLGLVSKISFHYAGNDYVQIGALISIVAAGIIVLLMLARRGRRLITSV